MPGLMLCSGANAAEVSKGGATTAVSPETGPVIPPTTPAPVPPPSAPVPPTAPVAPAPPDSNPSSTTPIQSVADQTWAQIGDYTFEQRGQFFDGLKRLEAQLGQSITKLKARRTAFTGDPNVWDSEMKRLDDARAYLQSMSSELSKATVANWDDRKEKVSVAWEHMQSAYDRAKAMAIP